MPTRPWPAALAILAGILAPGGVLPASAQPMLYENRLPEGTAYVRFVNTLPEGGTVTPAFADPLNLGKSGGDRVGPYMVVENAAGRTLTADVKLGPVQKTVSFALQSGKWHTLLLQPGGGAGEVATTLVTDEVGYNQLRARLSFFNATPQCKQAALALEPGGQSVFTGVATGTMKVRSVNAVASQRVRAECDGRKAPTLDLGRLDAGGLYSVWLVSPGGTPETFLARDLIAPYRR